MLLTPGAERKVLWQELLRHELLDARARGAVVIVPVGSIEQHGPHLPLDVDISVPYHLAVRAAVRCTDLPVLVAPPVTFGVAHYKMGEPGTISLRLETFLALLCDVARSVWQNGFRRIILLNGHGGNIHPVGAAAVTLSEEDVWTIPLTYWQMVSDELAQRSDADAGSIGHAGEWETSLQLALRPELIDMARCQRHVGDAFQAGGGRLRTLPRAAPGDGDRSHRRRDPRIFRERRAPAGGAR